MSIEGSPRIRLSNVTLGYEGHPAVHHLNGEIPTGSMTAIVGPNGSGKSTLLKGIVGLLKPMDGHIDVDGLGYREISYLPQQANIDRSFPISVAEMASLGLWSRCGAFGRISKAHKNRISMAISAVGLEGFEHRTLDTLSGGQLQRALFARVLVQDSPLILLDEPFNAIDANTAADLMVLIERWHSEARTIVAVVHDLELAKERFPNALLMAREKIAWGKATEVITPANLLKARSMSECWDDTAPWCERDEGQDHGHRHGHGHDHDNDEQRDDQDARAAKHRHHA
ncbi:MAG: ABC transporter ATP-binding protein [Alphaproteobacteria bacterium]|nr:ABC transporter ATP-binding protein [Alphaproteobacteria bacterium]